MPKTWEILNSDGYLVGLVNSDWGCFAVFQWTFHLLFSKHSWTFMKLLCLLCASARDTAPATIPRCRNQLTCKLLPPFSLRYICICRLACYGIHECLIDFMVYFNEKEEAQGTLLFPSSWRQTSLKHMLWTDLCQACFSWDLCDKR